MGFTRVASFAELQEKGALCVKVGEREIGLFRAGDEVYAMDNICPHAGLPLHEGEVEGTAVICAGHGWEFDFRTGLAPGEVNEEPLDRFPVRVEGDDIWIDLDRSPPA